MPGALNFRHARPIRVTQASGKAFHLEDRPCQHSQAGESYSFSSQAPGCIFRHSLWQLGVHRVAQEEQVLEA